MTAQNLPDSLRELLDDAGLGAPMAPAGRDDARTSAPALPHGPGAYVLVLELAAPIVLPDRFDGAILPPGWYLYCGSARGPGGIAARVTRHFARTKKPHWHVDQVTVAAAFIAAVPVPDGDECALTAALSRSPRIEVPVPGFGSTDCRVCTSHLLRWRAPEPEPRRDSLPGRISGI